MGLRILRSFAFPVSSLINKAIWVEVYAITICCEVAECFFLLLLLLAGVSVSLLLGRGVLLLGPDRDWFTTIPGYST